MNRNAVIRKARSIIRKRNQSRKIPTLAVWYYGQPEPKPATFTVHVDFPEHEIIAK